MSTTLIAVNGDIVYPTIFSEKKVPGNLKGPWKTELGANAVLIKIVPLGPQVVAHLGTVEAVPKSGIGMEAMEHPPIQNQAVNNLIGYCITIKHSLNLKIIFSEKSITMHARQTGT